MKQFLLALPLAVSAFGGAANAGVIETNNNGMMVIGVDGGLHWAKNDATEFRAVARLEGGVKATHVIMNSRGVAILASDRVVYILHRDENKRESFRPFTRLPESMEVREMRGAENGMILVDSKGAIVRLTKDKQFKKILAIPGTGGGKPTPPTPPNPPGGKDDGDNGYDDKNYGDLQPNGFAFSKNVPMADPSDFFE